MATVTFPIELGGSGLVVSDDTDPSTGLRNGGYLTRFVPALQQTVAVAGFVVGQANAAALSASAASSSASSAASSAASAATLYDQFDDRYLGPKATNPTVDNDGNPLLVGAMYFNTTAMETRVWNGAAWQSPSVIGGTVNSLTVTGSFGYHGALTGGTGEINIGSGQFYKSAAGAFGFGATSTLGFRGVFADSGGNSLALLKPTATLTTEAMRLRYYSANTTDGATYDLGGIDYVREDGGFGVRSSMLVTVKRSGAEGNLFEAARFTSAGYFKASNTGTYPGATSLFHELANDANTAVLVVSATNTGSAVNTYNSQLPLGATGYHAQYSTNNAVVYQVLANGNVQNTNNSYGAISDPKLKDIIGPKASTWEKTKQYNWIEYYLKSDAEHAFKMLGLNAEEAAAISPGVVDETADLVEVNKVRQVPVQIVRTDESGNPVLDEQSGDVIYDEVLVDEEYIEWEPNGEFTKSVKYSVVGMQYHRTTQECQARIESLESAKNQSDDLIQQVMGRVAALEALSS